MQPKRPPRKINTTKNTVHFGSLSCIRRWYLSRRKGRSPRRKTSTYPGAFIISSKMTLAVLLSQLIPVQTWTLLDVSPYWERNNVDLDYIVSAWFRPWTTPHFPVAVASVALQLYRGLIGPQYIGELAVQCCVQILPGPLRFLHLIYHVQVCHQGVGLRQRTKVGVGLGLGLGLR